jgi:type II secretory pathway component GspD/PulD (secretin)
MKNEFFIKFYFLTVVLSLTFVTACAPPAQKVALIKASNSPLEIARAAYTFLEQGDRRNADRLINTSLQTFPNNSVLHSVRAALFEIDAMKGDGGAAEKAETGYRFAIASDPSNVFASRSYSDILLSKGDYNQLISVLSKRLYAFPNDFTALHKLAIASYLNGDPYTAAGALDRAQSIDASSVDSTSLFAIVTAAVGDHQASQIALDRLYNLDKDDKKVYNYTKKRVSEWSAIAQSLSDKTETLELMQVSTEDLKNKSDVNLKASASLDALEEEKQLLPTKWGCAADEATTNKPDSETEFTAGSFPAQTLPAIISLSDDEYSAPAMVTIDAVFVRSEEVVGKTYGINLLDLLQANFSITSSKTKDSSDGNTSILTKAWSIFSDQNLSYSLNIANNFSNRAEVLNRPTLTTLNCRSAHFFSGTEVSVIAGGSESSALIEKPIGVGLTVTPTILDSETVILNLALARTFLEVASNVAPSLNQTLQTSSTLLNTSVVLKFGETLIVSGITSTDRLRNNQGVPLLEKLPVIQYLTSNRLDTDNEKSVIVLLTPRRPSFTQNGAQGIVDREKDDDETRWVKKMLRKKYTPPSNTASTLAHLVFNRYYRYIRRGDAVGEPWTEYKSTEGQIKILKEFLWF